MSSFLYTAGVLVSLIGLWFWAGRRAASIRARASEREQEAMAVMLGGGRRDPDERAAEAPGLPEPPPRLSRVLDDPSAKFARPREAMRAQEAGADREMASADRSAGVG